MATKIIFRTQYNFKLAGRDVEKKMGKSQTIKDETYTIRQLVERSQNGFYPGSIKESIWDPNPSHSSQDLEKLHHLDLSQKHEILQQTRENVLIMVDALESHKKKVKNLQKQAADQAEAIMLEKLALRNQQLQKEQDKLASQK